ncbi:hypothetical protein D3C84_1249530 [compost metagenome]
MIATTISPFSLMLAGNSAAKLTLDAIRPASTAGITMFFMVVLLCVLLRQPALRFERQK